VLGCARGVLRVRARDGSHRVRLAVRIDRRKVRRVNRSRARIRLGAGAHRVVIRARDGSDNVAVKRLGVRRCL
jgi:hypothetical protein